MPTVVRIARDAAVIKSARTTRSTALRARNSGVIRLSPNTNVSAARPSTANIRNWLPRCSWARMPCAALSTSGVTSFPSATPTPPNTSRRFSMGACASVSLSAPCATATPNPSATRRKSLITRDGSLLAFNICSAPRSINLGCAKSQITSTNKHGINTPNATKLL